MTTDAGSPRSQALILLFTDGNSVFYAGRKPDGERRHCKKLVVWRNADRYHAGGLGMAAM